MKKRTTPDLIENLAPNEVFVFGSNLDGFHAGGAARIAHEKFGAVWGEGIGLHGQTYAIPTIQDSVEAILPYVEDFIRFAADHPEKTFLVTRIGCGIAGFREEDIAPLFRHALSLENVILPSTFLFRLALTHVRITSREDANYAGFAEIYENAFPLYGQRTAAGQEKILKDPDYHLDLFLENGRPVGFIAWWELEHYRYIEHFAISADLQDHGYGTMVLYNFLDFAWEDNFRKTILIETDRPTRDVFRDRLRFFRSFGFQENPIPHIHPSYRQKFAAQPLILLSYRRGLDTESYRQFREEIAAKDAVYTE